MMNEYTPEEKDIAELAYKLDRFAENYDPYEYMDQVDDVQAHILSIMEDLRVGNIAPYLDYLDTAIEESCEVATVESAKALKKELDTVASDKKESVIGKLAQEIARVSIQPYTHKHKEPER